MNNPFRWAAGIVALIPGVAALATGLAVPPLPTWLFALLSETLPVLAVLAMAMFHTELRAARRPALIRWAGISAGVFLVTLLTNFLLQSHCLVVSTKPEFKPHGPVYFPLWLSDEVVAERVAKVGGRQKAVDAWGGHLDQVLAPMEFALATTSIVLVLVYAICSVALVVAFALFWFYFTPVGHGPNVRDPASPHTPTPPPLEPASPRSANDLAEGND